MTDIKLDFFDCTGGHDFRPVVPVPATEQSACADLVACLWKDVLHFDIKNEKMPLKVHTDSDGRRFIRLDSGSRACIPTGWRVIIPHGYQMKLVPRSGLGLKHGITLINSPGTIDSDYTDELMVLLHNTAILPYRVYEGDRICQMEIRANTMPRVHSFQIYSESALIDHKETSNRSGGLGSTGK